LHYADQGEAPRPDLSLNLTYTGSGDVPAVRALTHLFDQIQWDFRLESGAHLSWDAARASNLIFLGRPEQNPALQQLSRLSEFYFQTGRGIINAHPQSGESERYSSDSEYDYAVIAFTPGMDSKRNMLVLAGTLTEGTRAAVDCLTDESCIATLLNKLGVQKGSKVPYFEALLKVKINNNTPVWSSIITVHPYNADPSSWQVPAVHER
jgi:hypothetical protein